MWLGFGSDVFSDVVEKLLAEAKGKRFPAVHRNALQCQASQKKRLTSGECQKVSG